MVIPAPIEGEWLWDEVEQQWIPLIKTETGHPDIESSIATTQPPIHSSRRSLRPPLSKDTP